MGRGVTDRIRRTDESHYLLSESDGRTTYEGRTDTHASNDTSAPIWQIKRITYTNGQWETTYADSAKYNQIWDNRASLFPAPVGPAPDPDTMPITGQVSFLGLSKEGRFTPVVLSDTVWTQLPLAQLPDRNALSIQNTALCKVWLNYSNTEPAKQGVLLNVGDQRMLAVRNDIPVYAMSDVDGVTVGVEELA